MDTSVSDLKGESSTYGVQCSWAHPLSGRIPGEFNSLLTKALERLGAEAGWDGQRRGLDGGEQPHPCTQPFLNLSPAGPHRPPSLMRPPQMLSLDFSFYLC